jgi:hypothetical protein
MGRATTDALAGSNPLPPHHVGLSKTGAEEMRYITRLLDPRLAPRLLLIAISAAVLAAVTAFSAGAATTATFTLTAGGLSISAPSGGVSLGSQIASTSASTISGSLGTVTVSDQRGGVTTWVASVISTAFTPSVGPADPAANVSYAAGTIVQAGVVATALSAGDLTGVTPIVDGASAGISTATWNPTISVVVPANYAPGIYVATITHSVA